MTPPPNSLGGPIRQGSFCWVSTDPRGFGYWRQCAGAQQGEDAYAAAAAAAAETAVAAAVATAAAPACSEQCFEPSRGECLRRVKAFVLRGGATLPT